MGCSYRIDGAVKVRDNEASREILDRLVGLTGEIEVSEIENGDETFTVTISGHLFCSYTTASNLDALIQEFGPHAVDAAALTTECDGERVPLWVGTNEAVAAGRRQAIIDEAREAMAKLSDADRQELISAITQTEKSHGTS